MTHLPHPKTLPALLCVTLLLLITISNAQTLSFSITPSVNPDTLTLNTSIDKLEYAGTRVHAGVAVDVQEDVVFELGFRRTQSYGPVGNVVLQGEAEVSTAGAVDLRVAADGVLGSVAANAQASVFTVNPGLFNASDAYAQTSRARFNTTASTGIGLELGATYRINRTRILTFSPDVYYLTHDGLAARLDAELRFSKLNGPHDGAALMRVYATPGFRDAYGALGFEYKVNRRSFPSVRSALWLGVNEDGVYPGVTFSVLQTYRRHNVRYGLDVALEGYRLDALPYRFNAYYSSDVAEGNLQVSLFAAPPVTVNDVTPLGLRVAYAFEL